MSYQQGGRAPSAAEGGAPPAAVAAAPPPKRQQHKEGCPYCPYTRPLGIVTGVLFLLRAFVARFHALLPAYCGFVSLLPLYPPIGHCRGRLPSSCFVARFRALPAYCGFVPARCDMMPLPVLRVGL